MPVGHLYGIVVESKGARALFDTHHGDVMIWDATDSTSLRSSTEKHELHEEPVVAMNSDVSLAVSI